MNGSHGGRCLAPKKHWSDVLQTLSTIIAIVAGGIWFYMERSTKPQIRIEQAATQRHVSGIKDTWLVAIDVRVTNIGKVKVELSGGKMVLSQINPLPGIGLIETALRDLVLEPGESD